MSTLAEYLRTKKDEIRADAERRKAELENWQRAMASLVDQLGTWLTEADTEKVLKWKLTDHTFEDHDLFKHPVKGMQITLGDAVVRIVPTDLRALGVIRLPTEIRPQKITGRVDLENGTDRVPLYRVKVGAEDRWYWWGGGNGQPLDKESFEKAIVSLLR